MEMGRSIAARAASEIFQFTLPISRALVSVILHLAQLRNSTTASQTRLGGLMNSNNLCRHAVTGGVHVFAIAKT
jgi:hypothetical protein